MVRHLGYGEIRSPHLGGPEFLHIRLVRLANYRRGRGRVDAAADFRVQLHPVHFRLVLVLIVPHLLLSLIHI